MENQHSSQIVFTFGKRALIPFKISYFQRGSVCSFFRYFNLSGILTFWGCLVVTFDLDLLFYITFSMIIFHHLQTQSTKNN